MIKLGSDTGSLVNYMYANSKSPDPEVGMAATICGWSDRHAATVVDVFKYRGSILVTVQEDKATRIDKNGFSENQEYTYERNPNGRKSTFKLKEGRWIAVGPDPITCKGWSEGNGYGSLRLGHREEYYDHSF